MNKLFIYSHYSWETRGWQRSSRKRPRPQGSAPHTRQRRYIERMFHVKHSEWRVERAPKRCPARPIATGSASVCPGQLANELALPCASPHRPSRPPSHRLLGRRRSRKGRRTGQQTTSPFKPNASPVLLEYRAFSDADPARMPTPPKCRPCQNADPSRMPTLPECRANPNPAPSRRNGATFPHLRFPQTHRRTDVSRETSGVKRNRGCFI